MAKVIRAERDKTQMECQRVSEGRRSSLLELAFKSQTLPAHFQTPLLCVSALLKLTNLISQLMVTQVESHPDLPQPLNPAPHKRGERDEFLRQQEKVLLRCSLALFLLHNNITIQKDNLCTGICLESIFAVQFMCPWNKNCLHVCSNQALAHVFRHWKVLKLLPYLPWFSFSSLYPSARLKWSHLFKSL